MHHRGVLVGVALLVLGVVVGGVPRDAHGQAAAASAGTFRAVTPASGAVHSGIDVVLPAA